MKQKQLRKWNGRGHGSTYGNRFTIYVAAYSRAHAARLVQTALDAPWVRADEIRDYYAETWGNPMDGIEPTEPCVFARNSQDGKKPKRIL